MRRMNVMDIGASELKDASYDLGIFSAGYEERCRFVAQNINIQCARKLIFEFSETKDTEEQIENANILSELLSARPIAIAGDEESLIFEQLNSSLEVNKNEIRVVIDYSSMRRTWYASILNYFRFQNRFKKVELVFVYSEGQYQDNYNPLVITSGTCLPGCEGGTIRPNHSVAILGFGFDPRAPMFALEKLEADLVYGLVAAPGSDPTYLNRALAINKEVLNEHFRGNKRLLHLPIHSVQLAFQSIYEIAQPYLHNSSITVVPFGPKPHVLASVLAAMKFPQIACFYVRSASDRNNRVSATGTVSLCRVTINAQASPESPPTT